MALRLLAPCGLALWALAASPAAQQQYSCPQAPVFEVTTIPDRPVDAGSSSAARDALAAAALSAANPTAGSTPSGATSVVGGRNSTRGVSRRGVNTAVGSFIVPDGADDWRQWWVRNRDAFIHGHRPRTASVTAGAGRLSDRGRTTPRTVSRRTLYTRIVPDLLTILEESDEPVLLRTAAIALAGSVESDLSAPVVESLTDLLGHRDTGVSVSAAFALGLIGAEDSADSLLHLVTCSSTGHRIIGADEVPGRVRAAAALALGFLNDPRAVPPLVDVIERAPDTPDDTKTCSVLALGLMDNDASRDAGDFLLAKLADDRMEDAVRSAVPTALANLGRTDAVAPLLELLADRDVDRRVRQSAVIGLGRLARLDDEGVVDALTRCIEDERDGPTRQFAHLSLAKIGARDTATGRHADIHAQLTRLFGQQVTRPDRSRDRPWAALAAGVYGHSRPDRGTELSDRLWAAYEDAGDPQVKGALAVGLGLVGARDAGRELREDLGRVHDEAFRGDVAVALGLMGYREADGDLRAAAAESGLSSGLRRNLGLGLRLLGDPQAPDELSGLFEGAGTLAERLALSQALAALRHESVVSCLQQATADEALDPLSRAAACSALGVVAERDALPWRARLGIDSNYVASAPTIDELIFY